MTSISTMIWIFLIAAAVSLVATPVARRLAFAWDILDCPDGWRKRQRSPVPLLGGVAVLTGWSAAILYAQGTGFSSAHWIEHAALFISVAFLCLVGVCDDVWRIRVRWKMLAQGVATVPLIWAGFTIERLEFFGCQIELGAADIPISIAWYVACINALNLIDGMDGLASVCGLCISLFVAASICLGGGNDAALSGVALAGALVGFLAFNLPPAKIYLGDAGSMVVGLLGSWHVLEAAKQNAAGADPLVMMVFMALPLMDMTLAVLRRSLLGHRIWEADSEHVHHQLLRQRRSVPRVLAILGCVCIAFGALAMTAMWFRFDALLVAAALLLGAILIRWRLVGHFEWSLARQSWVAWRLGRTATPAISAGLAEMSFDEGCTKLMAETSRFPLWRMKVRFGSSEQIIREHRWNEQLLGTEDSETPYVVHIKFSTAENRGCDPSLETAEPSLFERQEWTGVLSLCRRLVRNWAFQNQVAEATETLSVPLEIERHDRAA